MIKASIASTFVGLAALLVPAIAQAQGKSRGIPEGHKPPAGMCRIWVDGVPAGQQPAATDCATALRNRPSNGRVIFGDEKRESPSRGTFLPKDWRGDRKEEPRREEPSRRSEPSREESRRSEPRRTEPRREQPSREPSRRSEPPRRERPREKPDA